MARPRKPPAWARYRRHEITPAFCDEAAALVLEGCTVKMAAKRLGIPPGMFSEWLRVGEEQVAALYASGVRKQPVDEAEFAEGFLWMAVARAEAERAGALLADVDDSKWKLGLHDQEFAPAAQRLELTGGAKVEVQIDHQHTLAGLVALGLVQPGPAAALDAEDQPVLPAPSD